MNWFYAIDGQQTGPVAFTEIERLHAAGQLNGDSLVWQQGQPNWVKLSTVLPPPPAAQAAPEADAPAPILPTPPVVQPSFEVAPKGKTNGMAIAALVVGIVALLSVCCGVALLIGAAAAICGHLAMKQLNEDPTQEGKGLALAGLILGYVSVVLGIGSLIYYILIFSAAAANPALLQ